MTSTREGWFLLCLALTGCGTGGLPTVPVTGQVTISGRPLGEGTVRFVPETGSPLTQEPVGAVGADGSYSLATGADAGAPIGKYKVVVSATAPSDPNDPYSVPQLLSPQKYADPATTDLAVEVVANPAPGSYDLKLAE